MTTTLQKCAVVPMRASASRGLREERRQQIHRLDGTSANTVNYFTEMRSGSEAWGMLGNGVSRYTACPKRRSTT